MIDIRVPAHKAKADANDGFHTVYFIEFEGPQLLKVGRTNSLLRRMASHQKDQGCIGRYVAQLRVQNVEQAKVLERAAIKLMRDRYISDKREWFDVDALALHEVIAALATEVPFTFSVHGASTVRNREEMPEYVRDALETGTRSRVSSFAGLKYVG